MKYPVLNLLHQMEKALFRTEQRPPRFPKDYAFPPSTSRTLRVFFGGNPHSLRKCLKKITVIVKAASFARFRYGITGAEQGFGHRNTLGGNIFVDGSAGGRLEYTAQIGAAQVKMGGQIIDAQLGINVLIDKGKNVVHLCMVCRGIKRQLTGFAFAVENTVQEHHKLRKNGSFLQIGPKTGKTCKLMYKITETVLFLLGKMELMGNLAAPVAEAGVQIRCLGRNAFNEIRINRQDNPFMDSLINLGQVMAFILVNKKNIPRLNIVEAVVNEKLLAS